MTPETRRIVRGSLNGLLWLENNAHNIKRAPDGFGRFLRAAADDARRAIAALDAEEPAPTCETCGGIGLRPDCCNPVPGDRCVCNRWDERPCPDCRPTCETCGDTGWVASLKRENPYAPCPDCRPECETCERDPSVTPGTCECRTHRDVGNVRPAKTGRQQPDKGERCETCGGDGVMRWEEDDAIAGARVRREAPCPDCAGEEE